MNVAIRADASARIGSGHVVRCITLADAIAARGGTVCFVTRGLPSHLHDRISVTGHRHISFTLPPPVGSEAPQSAWPVDHQAQDAEATRAALGDFAPDWLVVDHYGLDEKWEADMRPSARGLVAIDDLARAHSCDILVDANYHERPADRYPALKDQGTKLLLGPRYALLRPEFAQLRKRVKVRTGAARRVLVFLGGMDAGNATGRVLEALRRLPGMLEVDVVIGAGHPARDEIQALCEARSGYRCHVQTDDMPGLLADADVAIGAGGSATWERCCLGVPTIALALARNQSEVLAPAAQAGLLLFPDGDLPGPDLLAAHLQALIHNTALRQRMSAAGMAMVDGRGAARVVASLLGAGMRVRPVRAEDSQQLHAWRNAPAVRAFSRNSAPIALDEHQRWFDATLRFPNQVLLIGEDAAGPAGVVRFDVQGERAEVSIYLVESRLGQGMGPSLLRAAEEWLALHRPEVSDLTAEVLEGNRTSSFLFEQCSYEPASKRFSKRIQHT